MEYTWEQMTIHSKRDTGQEKVKCPICGTGRDKDLSIIHSKGLAKCHAGKCPTEGNPIWRESNKRKREEPMNTEPIPEAETGTSLTDDWIQILKERKISPETAVELGWTILKGHLCYPTRLDNGGPVVALKTRSKDKRFAQKPGGLQTLYNLNNIDPEEETLYIVEGEMDVAAMYEIGIKNVVSMPSKAFSQLETAWPYIKDFKQYVIGLDNDEAGRFGREELKRRLKPWKCVYIEYKHKDANGDLIAGVLEQTVADIKKWPVQNTVKFADFREENFAYFQNGLPDPIRTKNRCFGRFNDVFSVLPGQLTVVTGIPGSGKSKFVDWYCLNLLRENDMNGFWFSPEHGEPAFYAHTFQQKITGKSFSKKHGENWAMTRAQWSLTDEWLNKYVIFHKPDDIRTTWGSLIDTMYGCVGAHNTKIFVIDAFNKVYPDNTKDNSLDRIARSLSDLSQFCKNTQTNVFLVAHPRKPENKENPKAPGLYDISGSADFFNMTDNGLIVHRENFGEIDTTVVKAEKIKFQGHQGKVNERVSFNFNVMNERFHEADLREPDNSDWTKDTSEKRSSNTGDPRTQQEDVVPF